MGKDKPVKRLKKCNGRTKWFAMKMETLAEIQEENTIKWNDLVESKVEEIDLRKYIKG